MKCYTVKEAAATIGISKGTIYKLLKENKIQGLNVGRKIIIRDSAIENFLNNLEDEKNGNEIAITDKLL